MRISDWSSDVCSSDLGPGLGAGRAIQIVTGRAGIIDVSRLRERARTGGARKIIPGGTAIACRGGIGRFRATGCPFKDVTGGAVIVRRRRLLERPHAAIAFEHIVSRAAIAGNHRGLSRRARAVRALQGEPGGATVARSEEHTSELQSLM